MNREHRKRRGDSQQHQQPATARCREPLDREARGRPAAPRVRGSPVPSLSWPPVAELPCPRLDRSGRTSGLPAARTRSYVTSRLRVSAPRTLRASSRTGAGAGTGTGTGSERDRRFLMEGVSGRTSMTAAAAEGRGGSRGRARRRIAGGGDLERGGDAAQLAIITSSRDGGWRGCKTILPGGGDRSTVGHQFGAWIARGQTPTAIWSSEVGLVRRPGVEWLTGCRGAGLRRAAGRARGGATERLRPVLWRPAQRPSLLFFAPLPCCCFCCSFEHYLCLSGCALPQLPIVNLRNAFSPPSCLSPLGLCRTRGGGRKKWAEEDHSHCHSFSS